MQETLVVLLIAIASCPVIHAALPANTTVPTTWVHQGEINTDKRHEGEKELTNPRHGGNLRTNPLHRVICQFNSAAKDRGYRYSFTLDDFNPHICTHLFYHQIFIEDLKDISPVKTCTHRDEYLHFTEFKYSTRNLRFFITVGEKQAGVDFARMVGNKTHLSHFVSSITSMLRLCHFHGVNLEFKVTPTTSKGFTELIRKLDESFKQDDLITNGDKLELAATVYATANNINSIYQVPIISPLLDMITIMSFEDNSDEDQVLRVTNRLYPPKRFTQRAKKVLSGPRFDRDTVLINDEKNSVDAKIRQWIKLGINSSKINLAISLIGRGYVIKSANHHSIGDPIITLSESTKTHLAGRINYNELCIKMTTDGRLVRVSPTDRTPYWYHHKLWVNFEDELSIVQKVEYLRTNGLLGVSLISQAEDEPSGEMCHATLHMSKLVYKISGVEQILQSMPDDVILHCD